jgi:hypothetical protein
MISKTHTLDGVKVVPGLRVWDYDLHPRIVGEVDHVTPGGHEDPIYDHDPWYRMINPETGLQGSSMNPSRMWFYHPSTQRKA